MGNKYYDPLQRYPLLKPKMKLNKPTLAALVAAPIAGDVASAYNLAPRFSSSSPVLLASSASPVSRMMEKQRMIAQRMFDMVDQQQQVGGIYPTTATRGYPTHRYELVDNNEKFELTVDVPGVKEEDIDIKLEENLLTVQGQRTASSDSSQFTSKFSKTFSLDQTVDVDKFTASLKNGVLTVAAPKDLEKLEENVRRIPVLAAVDAPASEEGETAAIASGGNDDSQKTEHTEKEEAEESMDLDKEETSDNASKDGKE